MWKTMFAVALGSAGGGVLRWWLSARLNDLWPQIPPGTLLVNLAGGYLIGAALAVFLHFPDIAPEWRLLVMSGFCGGLTTFSTFSLEIIQNFQEGRVAWALALAAVHVLAAVVMTALGIWSVGAVLK